MEMFVHTHQQQFFSNTRRERTICFGMWELGCVFNIRYWFLFLLDRGKRGPKNTVYKTTLFLGIFLKIIIFITRNCVILSPRKSANHFSTFKNAFELLE